MALGILDEFDTIELVDADLVDGGDPDVVYVCRVVTPAVTRRLEKQANRRRPTGKANVEERDANLFVRLMIEYIITDWRGIVNDKTGEPVGPDDMVRTADGPEKARHVVIDSARYSRILETVSGNRIVNKEQSFRPTA